MKLKDFFISVIDVISYIIRPSLLVMVFKVFAILGILVFLYAYYHAFRSYQAIHKTYSVGEQQSRECGFEYLEKESGIHRLYEALTDPDNPLQERFMKSITLIILVIAIFTVCILAITLYYMMNDANASSLRKDLTETSWTNLAKIGIYLRYILLRAIVGVGLLVYFYTKQSIFIPDFKKEITQKNEEANQDKIADPKIAQANLKTIDRTVKATITRQWLLLTAMALTIFIMKKFYVPTIPISPLMLTFVEVIIVMGILLLTGLTYFYSQLQIIIESKYIGSVKKLNDNIVGLLDVPVFRDYFVKNAIRQEKYSDEPFNESQLARIANDGKLHLYMKHHATRNDELEFMTAVERGKSRTNKVITWSPVVYGVREHLNTLRQADHDMSVLFRSTNLKLFLFFMLPVFIVFYGLFHMSYVTNAYNTVIGVICIFAVLFILIVLLNMGSLIRPKDPPPPEENLLYKNNINK